MKVYRFYINKEFLKNSVDAEFLPITARDDSPYTLYAVTCDKNVAKRFKKDRSDCFIMNEIEISKKEYHEFTKDSGLVIQECERISEDDEDEKYILLMTENERLSVSDGISDVDYLIAQYASTPYDIFNDEILKALDYILYPYYHATMLDDENDLESMASSMGYNCSPLGYKYGIRLTYSYINRFISIFAKLFK